MRLNKNVVFIGFMGCGKTTFGKKISRRLKCPFIDTDKYIENNSGMTISDIFASKGEPYFRSLETDVCRELSDKTGYIISTGGGIIKSEENMRLLKKNSVIVYLKATPEHIFRNIGNDNDRPLLRGGDKMEKITKLMNERIPVYESLADITVFAAGDTVSHVTDKILKSLEEILMRKYVLFMGLTLILPVIRKKVFMAQELLMILSNRITEEAQKMEHAI